MRYSKPSEFLRELDSHGIYNAAMLDECDFDTDAVPTHSIADATRSIERRGLGGDVRGEPDDRLIYGWQVATALARTFLGDAPGLGFHGRGSSFRADLKALEEAGQ